MTFEGVICGPALGASASMIGVMLGRLARPELFFVENLFGIAEAAGAVSAGLLFTGRWKAVSVTYVVLLGGFFLNPLARVIPLWTLWNVYLAFFATFPAAYVLKRLSPTSGPKLLLPAIALTTFVSVELDVLVRVFMLIVMGLYRMYPIPIDLLPGIFVAGALATPIEAGYAVVLCSMVGVPLLISLEKSHLVKWPVK